MKNSLKKFKKFETNVETIFGGQGGPVECCFGLCKNVPFPVFENCMDFCLSPVSTSCGGIQQQ